MYKYCLMSWTEKKAQYKIHYSHSSIQLQLMANQTVSKKKVDYFINNLLIAFENF